MLGDHPHVAGERAIDELDFDRGKPGERAAGIVSAQGLVSRLTAEREVKVVGTMIFDEPEAKSVEFELEPAGLATQEL